MTTLNDDRFRAALRMVGAVEFGIYALIAAWWHHVPGIVFCVGLCAYFCVALGVSGRAQK